MTVWRVLDLFSGLRGWTAPFTEHGHETFAIDIDQRFSADAHLDIGEVAAVLEALPWRPDVIFASPPCNSFSTGSMGKMYEYSSHPAPKRDERYPDGHPIAIEGMRLVSATLRLMAVLQPRYWVIENPVNPRLDAWIPPEVDRRQLCPGGAWALRRTAGG